jgi:hypothetical protein
MKLSETIAVLTALKTELGDADPVVAYSSDGGTKSHDLSDIAIVGQFDKETKKLEMAVELKLA